MKVFVAGSSGAVGRHLVPQLVEKGHEVIGTHKSAGNAGLLRALGAAPVELDLLDSDAVLKAVLAARPEAIVHEATSLAELKDFKHFDRSFALTNRLRTEGTDALLAAAREAGARRIVAQSYAPIRYARTGGPVKTEDDPLESKPPPSMRETFAAMRYLDESVVQAGGIILRYGAFYGDASDVFPEAVRKRQFPIVSDGGGVTSFIHLYDAAAATVLALEHDSPAIYNIVDDEPAPVRDWLPLLADALGAKPPRRVPPWLARLFVGDAGVMMATSVRGASNAKAKRELGWKLRYPSWRQGFFAVYATNGATEGRKPMAHAAGACSSSAARPARARPRRCTRCSNS
jgi:nucleoside-diphosphate-sugar epimerase